jgi:hypothetical protein
MPLIWGHDSLNIFLSAADLIEHFVNDLQTTKLVAVNQTGIKPDLVG